MNKTKFIKELIKKYNGNISYSVLSEENEKIFCCHFLAMVKRAYALLIDWQG